MLLMVQPFRWRLRPRCARCLRPGMDCAQDADVCRALRVYASAGVRGRGRGVPFGRAAPLVSPDTCPPSLRLGSIHGHRQGERGAGAFRKWASGVGSSQVFRVLPGPGLGRGRRGSSERTPGPGEGETKAENGGRSARRSSWGVGRNMGDELGRRAGLCRR